MTRLIGFLFIVFLFLVIIMAGIRFIGEPIYSLKIWNSSTWRTIRIPVIVAAVAVGLGLLLFANSRCSANAERALREFAIQRGWGYATRNDDMQGVIRSVTAKLERVCPDKKFDIRTIMTIREGEQTLFLLICWYEEQNGGKANLGSASFVESGRFPETGPQTNIYLRTSLDSALLPRQVDMEENEFSRTFIVQSRQSEVARKTVSESLQEVLLAQRKDRAQSLDGTEIIIGPGGAVVLRWAQILPEEWPALAEVARRIESAMQ